MTDIRARLANALYEQAATFDECSQHYLKGWAERSADVLLSLPGIAIVDTEADIDRLARALRHADTEVFANNPADEYEKRTRNMVKAVLAAAVQAQEGGDPDGHEEPS
jgi:hypothetical protein